MLHIYMVTVTTWTFVYKEVAICACAAAKRTRNITQILLSLDDLLMFYQAFGVNLSFNRCGMFVAGRAYTSIRGCTSIQCYKDIYGITRTPVWPVTHRFCNICTSSASLSLSTVAACSKAFSSWHCSCSSCVLLSLLKVGGRMRLCVYIVFLYLL